MAFVILAFVILVILIVWWALLRNAQKYRPDFPIHTNETEHATARGEDTHAEERAASRAMGMEPPPVVASTPAPPAAAPIDQPYATDYGTPAPDVMDIPSAADSTAMQPVAPTDAPLVSDTSMYEAEPTNTSAAGMSAAQSESTQIFDMPTRSEAAGMAAGGMADIGAPDDLAILEGIGPRVKEVLGEAGIYTFAALAATDVNRLREILEGANLRFLDPGTWPEQAKLAAEGRMDDLQTFTDQLRGGRRTNA